MYILTLVSQCNRPAILTCPVQLQCILISVDIGFMSKDGAQWNVVMRLVTNLDEVYSSEVHKNYVREYLRSKGSVDAGEVPAWTC